MGLFLQRVHRTNLRHNVLFLSEMLTCKDLQQVVVVVTVHLRRESRLLNSVLRRRVLQHAVRSPLVRMDRQEVLRLQQRALSVRKLRLHVQQLVLRPRVLVLRRQRVQSVRKLRLHAQRLARRLRVPALQRQRVLRPRVLALRHQHVHKQRALVLVRVRSHRHHVSLRRSRV